MSRELNSENAGGDAERREIESAFRSLAPRAGQLDRDRLLFLAGRATARPQSDASRSSGWRLAATALLALAIGWGLGRTAGPREEPQVAVRAPQSIPQNVAPAPLAPASDTPLPAALGGPASPIQPNLLVLRTRIFGHDGMDLTPSTGALDGDGPPPSLGSLRARWLRPSSSGSEFDLLSVPAPRASGALL